MVFLRLLPVILSFLLLAAHFSRIDIFILMVLSLLLANLLFIKRVWVARLLQIALVLGALEWMRAMLMYIQIRKDIGEDWIRLAIILAVVALFTGLSALTFQGKTMKLRYGLGT